MTSRPATGSARSFCSIADVIGQRLLQRGAVLRRHLVEGRHRLEGLGDAPVVPVDAVRLLMHPVVVAAHALRGAVPVLLGALRDPRRRVAVGRALGKGTNALSAGCPSVCILRLAAAALSPLSACAAEANWPRSPWRAAGALRLGCCLPAACPPAAGCGPSWPPQRAERPSRRVSSALAGGLLARSKALCMASLRLSGRPLPPVQLRGVCVRGLRADRARRVGRVLVDRDFGLRRRGRSARRRGG